MDIPANNKIGYESELSTPQIQQKREEKLLSGIGDLLAKYTPYDLLPISYKVVLLDAHLPLKKALGALNHNGLTHAPIFNSANQKYIGLLTSNDFISMVQYFTSKPYQEAMDELESMEVYQVKRLESESLISNEHPSISPIATLKEASLSILSANSHILPVIDHSENQDVIVTVLTQYSILRFLAVNFKSKSLLNITVGELGLGTYTGVATCKLNDRVLDVVHQLMQRRVAAVPIVDDDNVVINVFENNDILTLLKEGDFSVLDRPIVEALTYRSETFEGVHRCQSTDTLKSIFLTIKNEMVNRLIVVDANDRLEGIITLSDLLSYFLTDP